MCLVTLFLLTCFSCSRLEQDIKSLEVDSGPRIVSRSEVSYEDWVDQVNDIKRKYFDSEDILQLDFDWFYDEYLEIDPYANQDHKANLKAHIKRTMMSVEHVSLSNALLADPFLSDNGRNALLSLKQSTLMLLNSSATMTTIQAFLQSTAEGALEDTSLNVVDQAVIFLSCVGIETALDPELDWSNLRGKGDESQSRMSCNFRDIALDFILISTAGAIAGVITGEAAGLIGIDIPSLTVGALINLSSPAVPYILIGSAVASILINCWEVISDFFENLWDSIRDFFVGIFGGGTVYCETVSGISAQPLDCSGDLVRFTASGGGADIVAYSWFNTHTIPQAIVTQTRSFSFQPTNDQVTIRVTPICSDPGTSPMEVIGNFDISDLIDNVDPTNVQFVDWPSSPTLYQTYRFHIIAGAGINEELDWTVSTGASIVQEGPSWADVAFYIVGSRWVTATITNLCNEDFNTETKTVFVN